MIDVSPSGVPVYLTTLNAGAAITTGAVQFAASGNLGLNLQGEGMLVGVWDGGIVKDHIELGERVIAKEGDTVRIVDGHVYVNDVPLHDDYVPEEFRSHDDWGPTVVQQGYYFVMGDHRNNSSDSRHWGLVPKKYIVGKVKVRWWPIQDARIF